MTLIKKFSPAFNLSPSFRGLSKHQQPKVRNQAQTGQKVCQLDYRRAHPCASTPHPRSALQKVSRRDVLIFIASVATASVANRAYAQSDSTATEGEENRPESHPISPIKGTPFIPTPKVVTTGENGLKQTDTGIAFIDFAEGEGRRPDWGDMIVLNYILYTINPKTNELVQHDSSDGYKDGYLVHHGNGEHILGLEQMLHTMSIGGRRRFILPQRLAYYQPGFAPIPRSNIGRKKLASDLSKSSGLVVMDVEVLSIWKDPNDRGYYDDLNLTDEELKELIKTLPREEPKPGIPAFYV